MLPAAVWTARSEPISLWSDLTFFGQLWVVRQVSIPWELRALPWLRIVQPYPGKTRSQAAALAWLHTRLQQMQIVQEFRELKGYWGLEQMAE